MSSSADGMDHSPVDSESKVSTAATSEVDAIADQADDSLGKLALVVTSDDDTSRESLRPAASQDNQDKNVKAMDIDEVGSGSKQAASEQTNGSKRKREELDSSSDEEEFLGFEECNGEQFVNSYKRIKQEISSEGEQDSTIIKEENTADDILKSDVKSELDEHCEENKPPDVSEKSDLEDKSSSAIVASSGKQRHIQDSIYKKPFALGWKREVVYRAVPGASKDKGEVYYITPMGKKIRTRNELQMHLTAELQLENFTFAREPIGMSADEEMIRVAKPTARSAPAEVTLGKRVPKPKGPKGASPPPQGWTPAKAVKSSSASSPRTIPATRLSDESDLKTPATPKTSSRISNKQNKKGEPCSIECVLAMGTIPQLQCVKCLCLYHHECTAATSGPRNVENGGHSSGMLIGSGGYVCEYCKNKTPSPLQQKPSAGLVASPPKASNNVGSISNQGQGGSDGGDSATKDLTKSQQLSTSTSSNGGGNKTASNSTAKNPNIPTDSAAALPQSIAVIKGRKYVVIRKPSNVRQDATNENSPVNPSSATGDDSHSLRKRGASARSSKSSENIQTAESSAGGGSGQLSAWQQQQISTHSDNFFSNVAVGYQILLQTFQYLKVQELLRAACVCRLWNAAANHRSLWRTVRMKNSQVNDWTGFAATLKRNVTRHLDLRKMISSGNSEEMWSSFATNIKEVESLQIIDLCRCSSQIVEGLFASNTNLKVLNAIAIKDESISLENINQLVSLEELRLKSIDGFSLESELYGLRALCNLKHLSLTSVRGLGTKDITVLGELTHLESLDLGECCDLGESFATSVLVNLVNLNRLRLEKGQENCCTLEILDAISQLTKLQQLELVNFDIKTGFEEKLSKCKYIKRLLLIPTYISQSATTNNIVLSAVLNLAETLQNLTWVVTLELLRVTALYVDQCDNKKKDKKFFDESIPVLKPVPGIVDELDKAQKTASDVPQVEILPLVRVEEILFAGMPNTRFKILKVPYHATWRQNLLDI